MIYLDEANMDKSHKKKNSHINDMGSDKEIELGDTPFLDEGSRIPSNITESIVPPIFSQSEIVINHPFVVEQV